MTTEAPPERRVRHSVIEYAGIKIPTIEVVDSGLDENPQAIREGRVSRRDRRVIRSIPIDDLTGGMGVQVGSETTHLTNIAQSDGDWAHQPGRLTPPPAVQIQNNLIAAVDFSGYAALNKRPGCVESALGGSGKPKLYWWLGPYFLGPTSDTNKDLVLHHTFQNNLVFVGPAVIADTDYLVFITDGTTNDVSATTDPTTGTDGTINSIVTALTLASGDRLEAVIPLANAGTGKNVWVGKYGGQQGFFETGFGDALDTPLVPSPNTATRSILPKSGAMQFTGRMNPSGAVNDATAGTVAWSNLANIGASDGSWATAQLDSGQSSQRMLVGFGLSAIPDGDDCHIEGLEVRIERSVDSGGGNDIVDTEVQFFVSGVAVGDNLAEKRLFWTTSDSTSTYGSLRRDWFAGLRGSDLANLTLAIRAQNDGASNDVILQVDHVTLSIAYKVGGSPRVYTTLRQGTFALNDATTLTSTEVWANPRRVLPSDGSKAVATFTSHGVTSRLFAGGYFMQGELPAGRPIDTVQIQIERNESNVLANGVDTEAALYIGSSAVSLNEADVSTEWGGNGSSISEETIFYDLTSFDLTTDDLPNLRFGYRATLAANTLEIDSIMMRVAYRDLGVQEALPLGGEFAGLDPVVRNRFWMLATEFRNDPSSRDVPRQLYRVDIGYDSASDRISVDAVQVPTPFTYNRKLLILDNELYVAGSQSSGPARTVATLNLFSSVFEPEYEVRADIRLDPYIEVSGFGQGLTETWGIADLWRAGDSVGLTLVTDDNAIVQDYVIDHRSKNLMPFGPRTALTTSTVFTPLGQTLVASETRYRYRFIADNGATKNLDVHNQYTLDDIHMDASVFLASIAKATDDSETVLPDFIDGFGDLPMNKALLGAYCLSRDIPADGYVKLYYSTDGTATWTLMATFAAFSSSNAGRVMLATPVAFKTIAFKIETNNGATTTAYLNALPIIIVATSALPVARRFRVEVDVQREGFEGMENLRKRIKAAHDSLIVRPLKIGTDEGMLGMWDDGDGAREPTRPDARSINHSQVLYFDEVVA